MNMSDTNPQSIATTATGYAALGKALYNQLMGEIEPELLSDNLPNLEEQYANESQEQKQERGQRYRAAFDLYTTRLQSFQASSQELVSHMSKRAFGSLEEENRQEEAANLSTLEQDIQSSS